MKADQPLVPAPQPLEALYLRHLLMRSAYLNRKERGTAVSMLVRARKRLKGHVDRLAERWGVSQQVVMTVALEHLVRVTEGVELWREDGR